ncbi:MAG: dockerin type I domain-containing protein [Candidatus Zixiibacteriota bacterium]
MRDVTLLLGVCLILTLATASAISWPIPPTDSTGRIGNSYGEFQYYGGTPYLHPGIDILAPAGTSVYAIKAGYVKAVLTTSADLHWRVAIGDSATAAECDGWLYAHLDQNFIFVNEGEYVEEGQLLGYLVSWPVADFHHLHFVKIRNSGTTWDSDWEFIGNPLDELEPLDDPDAPVIENAYGTQKLAFSQNQSSQYFALGADLSGDVDIICKAWDYINHYDWQLAPHQLEYKIEGDSSLPWQNSICFTGYLNWDNNVDVIYRDDAVCDTRGNYDYRDYYFYLTNTDGDSIIEPTDAAYSWETPYFHNGEYTISVRVSDRAGNQTIDSQIVTVANYFVLDGAVAFSDGNPDLDNVAIEALLSGVTDSTSITGEFSLADVGGGTQIIRFSREGYIPIDTTLLMNSSQYINVTLSPDVYLAGDPNHDGSVNVGDAVYIINYIFRGGPAPVPFLAGDVNGDSSINVGDAVYLINYIFKDGPPPVE